MAPGALAPGSTYKSINSLSLSVAEIARPVTFVEQLNFAISINTYYYAMARILSLLLLIQTITIFLY